MRRELHNLPHGLERFTYGLLYYPERVLCTSPLLDRLGMAYYDTRVNCEGYPMQDKTERWMELCKQAAIEQDPQKLLALVEEINALLEKKERRLE